MNEKKLMAIVIDYLRRNGQATVHSALANSLGEGDAREYSAEIEDALERKGLIDLRTLTDGTRIAEMTTRGKMYIDD